MQDKLIITKRIKKTIEYISKCCANYPHKYNYVHDRIINDCYLLLEYSYVANISKDLEYMKKMVVKIRMIEYYTKISLKEKLINFKKFEVIGNNLFDINNMINAWLKNEKNK